jgi:hypothetical protein
MGAGQMLLSSSSGSRFLRVGTPGAQDGPEKILRKLRPKLPESLGLAHFHAPRVTRRVMPDKTHKEAKTVFAERQRAGRRPRRPD